MNFIVGRHGGADPRVIAECVNTYLARGFVLNVVPVDLFVPTMLGLCREVSCDRFAKCILNTAMQTKFKETTVNYVLRVLKEHFGINAPAKDADKRIQSCCGCGFASTRQIGI